MTISMKKIVFFLFCLLTELYCLGQNTFDYQLLYDNTGNCVYRGIVFSDDDTDADDGDNDKWRDSIIENVSDSEISLYPNPTDGAFTLKISPCSETITATLTDISGATIMSKEVAGQTTFDIHDKSSGIYILKILFKGEELSWKVIKR